MFAQLMFSTALEQTKVNGRLVRDWWEVGEKFKEQPGNKDGHQETVWNAARGTSRSRYR